MSSHRTKFSVGQCVQHVLFNYRGVIYELDAQYSGTEDWYQQMALTRPPKVQPWYKVLVHNASYETYVAERNLKPDLPDEPVIHPLIPLYFDGFDGTNYISAVEYN